MADKNQYQDEHGYGSNERHDPRNRNYQQDDQDFRDRDNNNDPWNRNQQVNFWDQQDRPRQQRYTQQINFIPDHDDRSFTDSQQHGENDYRYGMQQQWRKSQNRNRSGYDRQDISEDEFRRSGFHAGYQQPYQQMQQQGGYGNRGHQSYDQPYRSDQQFGTYGSDYDDGRRTGARHDRPSGRSEMHQRDDQWNRGNRSGLSGEHRGKGPRGYERSQDRIMEDVCERLTFDERVDASEIEVKVDQHEVILTGTVTTREEKRRAEDLAESIPGVRNVENRIKVVAPGVGTTETMNTVIRKTGNMKD